MHHRERPMPPERAPKRRHVRDVAVDEVAVADRLAVAGGEVVEHDDLVARPGQRLRRVAPDVAGAAGDENRPRLSAQWRSK